MHVPFKMLAVFFNFEHCFCVSDYFLSIFAMLNLKLRGGFSKKCNKCETFGLFGFAVDNFLYSIMQFV